MKKFKGVKKLKDNFEDAHYENAIILNEGFKMTKNFEKIIKDALQEAYMSGYTEGMKDLKIDVIKMMRGGKTCQ